MSQLQFDDKRKLKRFSVRLKVYEKTTGKLLGYAEDLHTDGMKLMRNAASGLPSNFPHLKKARSKFIDTSNGIINELKLAKKMIEDFALNLQEKLN